ncbi:DUF3775 domain-containing protein [Azospirillum sp. B21]|nr:DUF3775 domain-containing protein [Azospirillum sp. B21]
MKWLATMKFVTREKVEKLIALGEVHASGTLKAWQGKFPGSVANLNDGTDLKTVEEIGKVPSWYDLLEAVAMLKPPAQSELHALLCLGIGWSQTWADAMARVQRQENQLSTMELAGFSSFGQRLKAGLAKFDEETAARA